MDLDCEIKFHIEKLEKWFAIVKILELYVEWKLLPQLLIHVYDKWAHVNQFLWTKVNELNLKLTWFDKTSHA